jgi:shikimate kinase
MANKIIKNLEESLKNGCTVLGAVQNALASALGPEYSIVTIDPEMGVIVIENKMTEEEYFLREQK